MREKEKKPRDGAKNTVQGGAMLGNFLPGIMGSDDPSLGNFEAKEQRTEEAPTD